MLHFLYTVGDISSLLFSSKSVKEIMEFSLHVPIILHTVHILLPVSSLHQPACMLSKIIPRSPRRISCSSFPAPPIASLSFSSLIRQKCKKPLFLFLLFPYVPDYCIQENKLQTTGFQSCQNFELLYPPTATERIAIPSSVHIRITNHIFSFF